jgi:signal peptidase II
MKKQLVFYCVLFIFVILIDQSTKLFVLSSKLFPVYFNNAIAFSLPVPWYLPWIVIIFLTAYYLLNQQKKQILFSQIEYIFTHKYLGIALPLIAGGGISNIIDRIFHNGAVVDFIDLRYWPVFNLADSAIVIGVILIIYHLYQKRGA